MYTTQYALHSKVRAIFSSIGSNLVNVLHSIPRHLCRGDERAKVSRGVCRCVGAYVGVCVGVCDVYIFIIMFFSITMHHLCLNQPLTTLLCHLRPPG